MTAPEWMTAATAKPSPDRRAERIRARAEQDRLDQAAALDIERQRLTLDRQKHAAAQQAKAERRHQRQTARAKRMAAINKALPIIGRRTMITMPIVSPMTVAWIGQILFAVHVLGWPIWAAVIFAASWELTTAFAGWMCHQARQDGDRGTLFRFATWLFAASAGAMNYWHALDGNSVTHPTPKAVSFGIMSLVGIGLWELYSSLLHRKELRGRGALPPARPRFGLARWARFPRHTYKAWSISIRDGLTTTSEAWSAVVTDRAPTADPNPVRVVIVTRPTGGYYTPMTALQRPLVTTPWGGISRPLTSGHPIPGHVVTDQPGDHPGDHPGEAVTDQPAAEPVTGHGHARKTTRRSTRAAANDRRNASSDPEQNARAVERYRRSVADGHPLSQRDLAAEFGRSSGWAHARIQEAGLRPVGNRPPAVTDHLGDQTDDHAADRAADRTMTAKESTG